MLKLLVYLLHLVYIFIILFVICVPFITQNNNILLLIIVMNIVIVTGWYLYEYCFITDIEKLLHESLETNNETISFITIIYQEYLPDRYKNHIHIFFSIIPLLSTIMCCLIIYLTKQPIRLFFDKGRNAFQRE